VKLRVPRTAVGRFFFFAITQSISYFLVVANTRAYTVGLYGWTGLTDGLFAAQNYLTVRMIAKDEGANDFWSGAGYTVGGVVGSLTSIYVTRHIYGR
jgi:hypothetical protein